METDIIYNKDCMKVFKEIPNESVDLIFTDPPFNIGKKYDEYKDTEDLFDYYAWCYLWIDECMRVLKKTGQIYIMNFPRHLAFLHQYMIKCGLKYLNWIAWVRNDNSPYAKKRGFKPNHQDILRFSKTDDFYFNWRGASRKPIWDKDKRVKDLAGDWDTWSDITYVKGNSKEKKAHPCMLPEKLLRKIILTSSKEGDIVLDCFAGSGTTLVVAKQNKRKFIGMEISEKYCKIIKERLSQEVLTCS